MNAAPNNRAYKGISLLIKAGILIFSFVYISSTLLTAFSDSRQGIRHANIPLLMITGVLLFVNWGLEALKWKLLIAPLETISFSVALKSVFAGVTVSIFMPNRIGEFAGRIFFLEKADKVEATLKNFVGGFMQFCITLLLGIPAFFIAIRLSGNDLKASGLLNVKAAEIVFLVLLAGCITLIFLNKIRARFSPAIQSYFKAIFDTDRNTFVIAFLLSFVRYCVFIFQYYLVLVAFGVQPGMFISLMIIAIAFLITSVIPSFALTEVVTRGAVAVSLFHLFTDVAVGGVVVASLLVWIINLAIPALIGSAFIWKLKFFKK